MTDHADWQRRAADKRAAQLELIPPAWRLPAPSTSLLPSDVRDVPHTSGILSDAELVITEETDAQVVLDKISRGEWTSTAVATAFCKRAAIAQQLVRLSRNLPSHHSTELFPPQTNCLTEPLFDRALARAAELDAHFATTGCLVGPLHGLPVSLKEQFDIEGVESTMGALSRSPLLWATLLGADSLLGQASSPASATSRKTLRRW